MSETHVFILTSVFYLYTLACFRLLYHSHHLAHAVSLTYSFSTRSLSFTHSSYQSSSLKEEHWNAIDWVYKLASTSTPSTRSHPTIVPNPTLSALTRSPAPRYFRLPVSPDWGVSRFCQESSASRYLTVAEVSLSFIGCLRFVWTDAALSPALYSSIKSRQLVKYLCACIPLKLKSACT